jgi:hypothetical protein
VNRGTLSSASGIVRMSHNNTQLGIVDGANGYVFTLASNTLAVISSAGWRGSKTIDFIDGYSIFIAPDTDQFYLSAIDNMTSEDPLDFSSADAQPDNLVTSLVLHRELILFGRDTTEIWVDSGGALFPFVRYNSAQIDVGCVGTYAACVAADSAFWIGQTRRGSGHRLPDGRPHPAAGLDPGGGAGAGCIHGPQPALPVDLPGGRP